MGIFGYWLSKKVGLGQLAGVDTLQKKVPKMGFFDFGATRPFNSAPRPAFLLTKAKPRWAALRCARHGTPSYNILVSFFCSVGEGPLIRAVGEGGPHTFGRLLAI